jgi:hypothetical protein
MTPIALPNWLAQYAMPFFQAALAFGRSWLWQLHRLVAWTIPV